MWVHEAMAAALSDLGVDTVFGLIGDSNLFMVDDFVRQRGGRYISAVHEAGAVMMAHGYASRSGRLGVATVTQGPGLTNAATAIVEAVRAGTPMLLLVGDTAPSNVHSLQTLDQEAFVAATGAVYALVQTPETATASIREAASLALRERCSVVVNCPTEYQWNETEYRRATPTTDHVPRRPPSDADLDPAVGVIATARRPLVLVGSGVVQASAKASVLRLAKRIGAPIATTLKARGLFDASEGCIGVFGTLSTDLGAELVAAADCVIAFGASLNVWTTDHNRLLSGKSVVQVDSKPDHIGRYAPVTVGVAADADSAAQSIFDWIEEGGIGGSPFLDQARPRISDEAIRWESRVASGFNLGSAINEIVLALPSETTIAFDGGRFLGEAFKYAAATRPEQQVLSTSFGAVGLGTGAAIGAAAAAPDDPTLLIIGDGGYMMSGMAELQSAGRNRLPLVVVICNDSSYGAEYDQFVNKGFDPALSLFAWPSFADTAAALGAVGVTVRCQSDLAKALQFISDVSERSVVIDVRIDPGSVPEVPH